MAEFNVDLIRTMAHARISIDLTDLRPGQKVNLRLISEISQTDCWMSHATFIADMNGTVSLDTQAPVSGSYRGVDGMGLFWSQTITSIRKVPESHLQLVDFAEFKQGFLNIPYLLVAESQGQILASQLLERMYISPDIERVKIRERGLVGTLFHHKDYMRRPGIICVGGSEGGLLETPPALLANYGFTVLSLAYFGIEHLPPDLVGIPLEYFKTGIDWFRAQDTVEPEPGIGVWGFSRGGELALLVAATYHDIAAVVSTSGAGYLVGGFSHNRLAHFLAAWIYQGAPLPSTIPVERIQAPVLLLSGAADMVWDSRRLNKPVLKRFAKYDFAYPFEHVIFPNAGHWFGLPYRGINHRRYGGSPQGNAEAAIDCWTRVPQFFKEHLVSRTQ